MASLRCSVNPHSGAAYARTFVRMAKRVAVTHPRTTILDMLIPPWAPSSLSSSLVASAAATTTTTASSIADTYFHSYCYDHSHGQQPHLPPPPPPLPAIHSTGATTTATLGAATMPHVQHVRGAGMFTTSTAGMGIDINVTVPTAAAAATEQILPEKLPQFARVLVQASLAREKQHGRGAAGTGAAGAASAGGAGGGIPTSGAGVGLGVGSVGGAGITLTSSSFVSPYAGVPLPTNWLGSLGKFQRRTFSVSAPARAAGRTQCVYNPKLDDEHKEMRLEITERAANRLATIARNENNPNLALRIQVESGGCHGFQYLMRLLTLPSNDGKDWSNVVSDDDTIFQFLPDVATAAYVDPGLAGTTTSLDGARVVIDHSSLELLRDSKVDFTMDLIGSQFAIVDNPHATSSCGCGTSFDIKI